MAQVAKNKLNQGHELFINQALEITHVEMFSRF